MSRLILCSTVTITLITSPMDVVEAHESKDGHQTIELAQLYDPNEMPQDHNQVHIYQDQYGRRIFVDERGNIVRVEEPSSYPHG